MLKQAATEMRANGEDPHELMDAVRRVLAAMTQWIFQPSFHLPAHKRLLLVRRAAQR